jgi:hypothetical protein
MRLTFPCAILLTCGAAACVLGCPSKGAGPSTTTVASPSTSASAAPVPRIKVAVSAVHLGSGGSVEVTTTVAFTPKTCDPTKYLQPPWDAGPRRRMLLFRVKDVSLVAGAVSVPARDGREGGEATFGNEGGEHAILIDCTNDAPDGTAFPYVFAFDPPAGFDPKIARLVLEGTEVALPASAPTP